MPGDQAPVRDLLVVNQIWVGVASPPVTVPLSPGALLIEDGPRQVVLTATKLGSLPAETRTVTFLAGTSAQTHTETGPTLAEVLRAARISAELSTWVAAMGSDGYAAAVTPGEAWPGGRPLLISPSGVYDLVAGQVAPAS